MLAQAQASLLGLIKAAPIGKKMREIEPLPDLPAEALIKRLATSAPAIYVDIGRFEIHGREAKLHFEILLLVKNGRTPNAAQQGDGIAIGLFAMVDAVLATVAGNTRESFTWFCHSGAFGRAGAFLDAGFSSASILCNTSAELEDGIDLASLDEFLTLHSDYDLPPFALADAHGQWLAEPPDHSTAIPPLNDHLTLANPGDL